LTILGTLLGYGISVYVIQKQYQATAMMIVSSTTSGKDGETPGMTLNDYNLNAKLVNSYSVLSKSDRVLSQVRDKLGINIELSALSDKIDVSSKNETDIISLSVTDASPQMAQSIANTLVDVFKTEVTEIMKMDNVQVIDYAALPYKPVSPNVTTNTVAAGLAGLVLSLIIAVLRYTMDDTIKESDLITDILDLPVIGSVPRLQ
jgi:capsular polysaccharide biosynthesis protein